MRTWSIDAVVHERLAGLTRTAGLTPANWIEAALANGEHEHHRAALHLSTMGSDQSRNFMPIDDPCDVDLDMRISADPADGVIHIREMPIGQGLSYTNYGWHGDGPDDDVTLWDRPVLLVVGTETPETVCAAMAGRRVGQVVRTGMADLDDAIIEWAAVEPQRRAAKLIHGRDNPVTTPSLILRLRDVGRIDLRID